MERNKIYVRDFTIKDVKDLAFLTSQLGYTTSEEEMAQRMLLISTHPDYKTILAVNNEIVVGYIGLNQGYFWEKQGSFIRIQALVVEKEFRQLNIGSLLVNQAEIWAKETNAGFVLLNCGNRPEREQAHQFYLKLGFQPKSTGYYKELI